MLALCAKREDVPRKNVQPDSTVGGLLHDPTPEVDLLVDRHPTDDLMVCEHRGPHHVGARHAERIVELHPRPPDITQRNIRKLRDTHHRGKGVEAPERDHVVAVTRHRIEKVGPEAAIPHLGDVGLGGIRTVRVARRPQIERNVELDAALSDVRTMVGVFQPVDRACLNGLRHVQTTIHGTNRIDTTHDDGPTPALVVHADPVALWLGADGLIDANGYLDRAAIPGLPVASPGRLTANLLRSKPPWLAGCGVVNNLQFLRHRGRGQDEDQNQDGKPSYVHEVFLPLRHELAGLQGCLPSTPVIHEKRPTESARAQASRGTAWAGRRRRVAGIAASTRT